MDMDTNFELNKQECRDLLLLVNYMLGRSLDDDRYVWTEGDVFKEKIELNFRLEALQRKLFAHFKNLNKT